MPSCSLCTDALPRIPDRLRTHWPHPNQSQVTSALYGIQIHQSPYQKTRSPDFWLLEVRGCGVSLETSGPESHWKHRSGAEDPFRQRGPPPPPAVPTGWLRGSAQDLGSLYLSLSFSLSGGPSMRIFSTTAWCVEVLKWKLSFLPRFMGVTCRPRFHVGGAYPMAWVPAGCGSWGLSLLISYPHRVFAVPPDLALWCL